MRLLLVTLILCTSAGSSLHAQAKIGGTGKIGGTALFKSGTAATPVSLVSSTLGPAFVNPDVIVFPSVTVANTGDASFLYFFGCVTSGCLDWTSQGCAFTVTDDGPHNTYTLHSASALTAYLGQVYIAANATAGTYTITGTASGSVNCQTLAFTTGAFLDLANANHTTPLQASAYAHNSGNSASPTVTSGASVAVAGSMGIVNGSSYPSTDFSPTAPYTTTGAGLYNGSVSYIITSGNLSTGSNTASGTQTSNTWVMDLYVIAPQ